MKDILYSRQACLEYALKYAESRHPRYYNFDAIGGNCTNYASQCLYAGLPVMNYSPYGWYYNSISNRSPSWTDVRLFCDFLLSNKNVGPYGTLSNIENAEIGDFIQLKNNTKWYHTLLVCDVSPQDILICANTYDSYLRPLSSYYFRRLF